MAWIKRSKKEPDPKLKKIIVFGKCGNPHIAYYDYECWAHTEHCYEDGSHFPGSDIDFDYWQKIPRKPRKAKV